MAEEKDLPEQPQGEGKKPWQQKKESWYDKIPVTGKQMDLIVAVCWILIFAVIVLIYLDVKDIFHLFG